MYSWLHARGNCCRHVRCAGESVSSAGELTRNAQHSSASRAEQKMLRSSISSLMLIRSQTTAASGGMLPGRYLLATHVLCAAHTLIHCMSHVGEWWKIQQGFLCIMWNVDACVPSRNLACRYVVYLESMAWSTNGRHKFSCGSVVISNKMGYYEFFTRALKPGVHYVDLDPTNLCDDLVSKVRGPM